VSDRRIVPLTEAAAALGVAESTIYRWIRLKLVKKYRQPFDRRTYVDLDELEEVRTNPPFHEAR